MRKLWAPIVFLSFLLFLAGCGDSDATSSKSEENANDNGEVKTIKIATPPTSKPLSWVDENDEITGYEPDVIRAIDEVLEDYTFDIIAVSDEAGETGLATGKYDMLAGGLFKTAEREDQYLIPAESDGRSLIKIYVHEDSDITSTEDLVGKKIVPPSAGGGIFNYLTNWQKENPEYELDFEPSGEGIPYPDRLKQVESGQYDALVLPSNLGQSKVIESEGLAIKTTDPVIIYETYLMVHKDDKNKALAEAVSNALKELKESGKLSELSEEYYGEDIFQY